MGRGPKPQLSKTRLRNVPNSANARMEKDLRISGCGICRRLIFSTQKYVWTRQMGYVHEEECLKRVT